MHKVYLDPREYLHDIWVLARQVYDSPWKPDCLIALWRGGAEVGVVIHEFLKVKGVSLRHIPLKCSSYSGIGYNQTEVRFEYADSAINDLKSGMKVLVVDDVFDTGRTAAAVHKVLGDRNVDMKMACVYWKPAKNQTDYQPDFYVKTLDDWLVFPHEIEGLSLAEIAEKDPMLATLIKG